MRTAKGGRGGNGALKAVPLLTVLLLASCPAGGTAPVDRPGAGSGSAPASDSGGGGQGSATEVPWREAAPLSPAESKRSLPAAGELPAGTRIEAVARDPSALSASRAAVERISAASPGCAPLAAAVLVHPLVDEASVHVTAETKLHVSAGALSPGAGRAAFAGLARAVHGGCPVPVVPTPEGDATYTVRPVPFSAVEAPVVAFLLDATWGTGGERWTAVYAAVGDNRLLFHTYDDIAASPTVPEQHVRAQLRKSTADR
ncbi:hypothetical protein [Streptomyces sp. NPDC097619]|uniref:hypothetical protein n=1 Tax=Streptomyces sp. NPDC097619 TaxID=3157228 RepID=UPI0033325700